MHHLKLVLAAFCFHLVYPVSMYHMYEDLVNNGYFSDSNEDPRTKMMKQTILHNKKRLVNQGHADTNVPLNKKPSGYPSPGHYNEDYLVKKEQKRKDIGNIQHVQKDNDDYDSLKVQHPDKSNVRQDKIVNSEHNNDKDKIVRDNYYKTDQHARNEVAKETKPQVTKLNVINTNRKEPLPNLVIKQNEIPRADSDMKYRAKVNEYNVYMPLKVHKYGSSLKTINAHKALYKMIVPENDQNNILVSKVAINEIPHNLKYYKKDNFMDFDYEIAKKITKNILPRSHKKFMNAVFQNR